MAIMLALAGTVFVSACSDDDEDNILPNGGYSTRLKVQLEMSCSIPATAEAVTIVWQDPADATLAAVDTVKSGESWQRTVIYDSIPDNPVGFAVFPLLRDNLQEGTEVSVEYESECNIYVLDSVTVVNFNFAKETPSYTFDYTDGVPYDYSDSYFYSVTAQEIKRVNLDDLRVDNDLTDVADQPSNEDSESVKGQGNLYYCAHSDVTTNNNDLGDNLLSRYPARSQWNGNVLSKEDYLFLYQDEFLTAQREVLKQSLANGAVLIVDAPSSYEAFKSFCEETGIYNPIPDDHEVDANRTMFVVANANGRLSNNPNCLYGGLFLMLTPDDVHHSEYEQGEQIDHVVTILNDMITAEATPSNIAATRSAETDLLKLKSATKVYICENDDEHVISKSFYYDQSKVDGDRTNHYDLEYDIWSVYSISENRNYYYIHEEFLGAFNNGYVGVYSKSRNGTVQKVCQWYGKSVTLRATSDNSQGMRIHYNSPETTTSGTTLTSGFSWNLGGSFGYQDGGVTGLLNGGITVSNSNTYTIQDVTVSNLCEPSRTLEWRFDITGPRASFGPFSTALVNITEGALVGRTSFTTGADFIISFPESTKTPKLEATLKVVLGAGFGGGGKLITANYEFSRSRTITLPVLSSSNFQQN